MTSSINESSSGLEYGGFWVRVFASLIDTLLYGILLAPILFWTMGDIEWSSVQSEGMSSTTMSLETLEVPGSWNLVINYLLPAVVVLIFWFYKSATPGKLLFKLYIVDAKTGEKPSLAQLLIRYLGYYISAMVFMLGFIWVGIDSRKQGWHDKLASTVVVRKNGKTPVEFN